MANGLIGKVHKPVLDTLAKLGFSGFRDWVSQLPFAVWAENTTTNNTDHAPFYLEYGAHAMLPIDLEFPTWLVHDWTSIKTTEELLAARARQIQARDEDASEAALRLRRLREKGQDLFDNTHQLRQRPLAVDDLVLVFRSDLENSFAYKLTPRWYGHTGFEKSIPISTIIS